MEKNIDGVVYTQEEISGKGLCFVPKKDALEEFLKKVTYSKNLVFPHISNKKYQFQVVKSNEKYVVIYINPNNGACMIVKDSDSLESIRIYLKTFFRETDAKMVDWHGC